MYCKYCGSEIPNQSAYCPACGKNLTKKPVIADLPEEPKARSGAGVMLLVLMAAGYLIPLIRDLIESSKYPDYFKARMPIVGIQFFQFTLGVALVVFLILRKKVHLNRVRVSDIFVLLVLMIFSTMVSIGRQEYAWRFLGETALTAANSQSGISVLLWGSIFVRWFGVALFLAVRSGGWKIRLKHGIIVGAILFAWGLLQMLLSSTIVYWLVGNKLPQMNAYVTQVFNLSAVLTPVSYLIYFCFCNIWGKQKRGIAAPLLFAITQGVLQLLLIPIFLGWLRLGVVSTVYADVTGSLLALLLLLVFRKMTQAA